jgi:prepilin-type processing-associated H-X9-DG protein
MPNFVFFLGSDEVCIPCLGCPPLSCLSGQLTPRYGTSDGSGWANANASGSYAKINYGWNLTIEGTFPYPYSGHPGGINVGFCDGSCKFISATIDGTVWAKVITPAGGHLPPVTRQLPVDQDAIAR